MQCHWVARGLPALVLLAVLPDERLQRTARLYLLAKGNTTAEHMDIVFADSVSYLPAVESFSSKPGTSYRKGDMLWLALTDPSSVSITTVASRRTSPTSSRTIT